VIDVRHWKYGDHWMRRLLTLLVGIVLGGGAVVLYMLLVPPTPTARVSTPSTLTPPVNPPMSVTLGEPFLTAIARDALAHAAELPPIDDVRVESGHGELIVRGTLEVLGNPVAGSATLRPVVDAGELHIEVVRTEFGQLPIPVERVIEQQINRRLSGLFADLPVTLTGVSIEWRRGMTVTCDVALDQLVVGRR
jgi:hypothetical protein